MSRRAALALGLALALLACSEPAPAPETPEAAPTPAAPVGPWRVEVALDAGVTLNACALGDVDPTRPGPELVAVGGKGEVFVVWREGEGWGSTRALSTGGELVQVAVGDVDPTRPGLEIVAVGASRGGEDDGTPGRATLIYRAGDQWQSERLRDERSLLHAVCPVPGGVLVAGYDQRVALLQRVEGRWRAKDLGELPGPARCAVPLPDDPGPAGAAFCCKDGSVVRCVRRGDDYELQPADFRASGRARLSAANDHLLVADDDGTLALVPGLAPGLPTHVRGQARVEIYRASSKLRGAVLADVDPSVPGLEACTCSGAGELTVLSHVGGRWEPVEVTQDTATLHDLCYGPLGDLGPVLAAASRGGRLWVARRR
ncbi:MAG TPA: hypothetical protein DEA08_37295 [Planctomycetes bacterium]|nr:hypothetical protein [Planctomycetota bacterium]